MITWNASGLQCLSVLEMAEGRIFITGQNKENLNQIFSRYTTGK
jgi:hypothetical protein